MEVAARPGGHHIQRLVALAHGIDLPAAMLRALSGPPGTETPASRPTRVAGVRLLTVPHHAVLNGPRRLEELVSAVSGCLEAEVTAGQRE